MQYLLILTFATIIFSCNKSANKQIKQHHQLVDWNKKFISEGGEHINDNFFNKYFKSKNSGDTLIIEALQEINSCGRSIADIKISNDTIYLLTRELSDTLCTSVDYTLFTYKILNKEKNKYFIVNEK